MIRVVFLLIVLIALVILASYIIRPWSRRMDEERLRREVDTYMADVRNGKGPQDLRDMSDTELRDVLEARIRQMQAEMQRKEVTLAVGSVAALFAALIVASQEGLDGLVYTVALTGLVGYGTNIYWTRKIREPLAAMGDDDHILRLPKSS